VGWWTRAFGGDARGPRELDGALRGALLAVLERDMEQAETLLVRAVRMDASGVLPSLALGRLYRMRGEIGRAIRLHQALLLRRDLAPDERTDALADLAADFQQAGFLRRAIASYEEVLSRQPRHRPALRALVRLLAQVREFPRALRLVRRLARLEKRDGAAEECELLLEMAETAQAEGRSDDARRAVKRALRRQRNSVRGWLLLGTLEVERGRSRAALAAWSRVPALDRRSGPVVYPRIEATYAALERTRDYERFLRDLLEARPDDPGARLALARTLAARGDADEAEAELQRLLEADPDDLEVRGALGRLLLSDRREVSTAFGELLDALDRRGLLRAREKLA
jgi:lipopolysaccharide biosynthesis regulator YciM